MKVKCKYIKAEGYDVVCVKNFVVLGDVMGYDGQQCENCGFYQPTETKHVKKKKRGT